MENENIVNPLSMPLGAMANTLWSLTNHPDHRRFACLISTFFKKSQTGPKANIRGEIVPIPSEMLEKVMKNSKNN